MNYYNWKKLISLILLLSFTLFFNIESTEIDEESETRIKSIEKCGSTEGHTFLMDSYRINKYNLTIHTYSANWTFLEEIGNNDTDGNIFVEVWGNGGWKTFMKKYVKNVCNYIKYTPKYANAIFAKMNVTGCPVPPGVYEIKDLIVNLDLTVPFPTGLYRMTGKLTKQDKEIFCLRFVIDNQPE